MQRILVLITVCAAGAPALSQGDTVELVRRLGARDSRVWSAAMERLTALGGDAVSPLEEVVRQRAAQPDDACIRAVRVLQRIGEPAKASVPVLLQAFDTPGENAHFKKALVLALGELAPHAPDARAKIRAAMLDALADRDLGNARMFGTADYLDLCATHARTLIGPETAEEDLLPHLTSDNPFLREYACSLFEQRTTATPESVAALHGGVKGDHPREVLLRDLGLGGSTSLGVYLDKRIKVAAARALVKHAPEDPRSIEGFTLLLERPETEVRMTAVVALRHAGENARPLLGQLMRMAQREEPVIRREAITALGMLGKGGEDATALLEVLTRDPDEQVAARARAALRQVRR